MAELFLARIAGSQDKLVALKKILPEYAASPKFVKLFLDEAKLVAALDHPHIAPVYDIGMTDGNYFFAMEYIHGKDVRSTLRRTAMRKQRFPLAPAVRIARDVASALHYAHERKRPDGTSLGIVHRDVSPSNILISYEGAVKLVDFGVAKAADSSTKTRTGTLKGKIAYMSPEQAKGASIDRRSDVFSLGIVLWEMLTTQRLFQADNDLATIQLIINSRPPPPSQLRPDCPSALDQIAMRALAADPAARYQTAEQLFDDLERLAHEETRISASPVSLRMHMHRMFDAEIAAWREAQEAGITLTDHVIATSPEATTPVSDSEIEVAAEDEEPSIRTDLDMRVGIVEVPEPTDDETTGRGTRPVAEVTETTQASVIATATRNAETEASTTATKEVFETTTTQFASGALAPPSRPTAANPPGGDQPTSMLDSNRRDATPTPSANRRDTTPIPVPVRRTASQPIVVDVAGYPTLRTDPSYATIQRERQPDRRSTPVSKGERRRLRLVVVGVSAAVIATLAGVFAAIATYGHGTTAADSAASFTRSQAAVADASTVALAVDAADAPPVVDAPGSSVPGNATTTRGDAVGSDDRRQCTARAPKEVTLRDRARCAIAACSAGDVPLATAFYRITPKLDQPTIVRACRARGVVVPHR